MSDRKLWLIDAAYLLRAQRTVPGNYQFNYKKLREKLETEGAIWRAYYFNSTPNPPSDQQDAFHSWLRQAPPHGPKIITKLYPLKEVSISRAYCDACQNEITTNCPNSSPTDAHRLAKQVQKGVDVGIATYGLIHMDKYDTLLLSSGDGDLLDMATHVIEQGKRLELVVFKSGVDSQLQSSADKVVWIDDFKDEVSR